MKMSSNSIISTGNSNNGNNSCIELKWFMNEEKSDVTFIVEGRKIPAIKDLLKHKSTVFEAMFDDSYDKVIEIEGTTYDAFRDMIKFIYCEHNYVISDESDFLLAMEVFRCGYNYKLKYLTDCIEQKLIALSNMDNIEFIYKFARYYSLEKFMKSFHVMMENKLDVILNKSLDSIKRLNIITDNYLLEVIITAKNKEIQALNDKINALTIKK